MEFRLLGPVEVRADSGELVELRPGLLGILVVLLVNPGKAVSQRSVVDKVWGEHPPSMESLYRYISTLRAEVRGDGVHWPRAKPGFWRLDVAPELVDYHRFRHHLDRARQSSGTEVEEHCRRALGECGSELLAGVDGPGLHRLRTQLERDRIAGVRLLAGALLDSGQVSAALNELDWVPSDHELDEEIVALRMRALAAAGQLRRLRDYVVEVSATYREEGTDLPARLRALHTSLLQQDDPIVRPRTAGAEREAQWTLAGGVTKRGLPSGGLSRTTGSAGKFVRQPRQGGAAAGGSRPAMRPRQLPAVPSHPVGRDRALAGLLSAVEDAPGVPPWLLIVEGLPGAGKHTFALQLAHRLADRYPDGQLYANLQGLDRHATAGVLRDFLAALDSDVPERSTVDYLAAGLRSALAGRRVLVLLSNARSAEQVQPLLPGHPGCLVVVTSSRRLEGLALHHDARRIELPPLPRADSIALLHAALGRPGSPGPASEAELDELAALCGDLPLALRIAGIIASRHPAASLSETIADIRHHRIDALEVDGHLALRATFATAHDDLGPQAQRLFLLLSLHPGPVIEMSGAAALSGLPRAEAGKLLDRLAHLRLLDQPDKHGYRLSDLSLDYARTCADEELLDTDRYAARRRLLDHFLHSAAGAAALITEQARAIVPGPPDNDVEPDRPGGRDEALRWFERNRENLLGAVDIAERHGFPEHAWRLAWASTDFLNLRSLHADWIRSHVIALQAARRTEAPDAVEITELNLANGYLRAQRYAEALALLSDAGERSGDPSREAFRQNSIGWAYTCLGLPARAIPHHRRALEHFQAPGQRYGRAHSLVYLCWACNGIGEQQRALEHGLPGLDLFGELGDDMGLAAAHHAIGGAHAAMRRTGPAVEHLVQAQHYWERCGDLHHVAWVLADLVVLHRATGEPERARRRWDQATARLDFLGEHPDTPRLRALLGPR
ncbi:AfsR/SARP family transcriptional regulator [Saccharopolyspora gregorii]|uniref:BTAD domain-containing putative transcriptional regulator n=1 Tax=Saccharopolyspora gregorii TaxID=33914 RepID=A0ABP6RU45_9PSEU